MKITDNIQKYAIAQVISEDEIFQRGKADKSQVFAETGLDAYSKACHAGSIRQSHNLLKAIIFVAFITIALPAHARKKTWLEKKVEEKVEDVKDTGKTLGGGLKDAAGDLKDAAKTGVGTLTDTTRAAVTKPLATTAESIKSQYDSAKETLKSNPIGELFKEGKAFAKDGLAFLEAAKDANIIKTEYDQLKTAADNMVNNGPVSEASVKSIRSFVASAIELPLESAKTEQLKGIEALRSAAEKLPDHIKQLEAARTLVEVTAVKCADAFASLTDAAKEEAGKALDGLQQQADKLSDELEKARLLENATSKLAPHLESLARLARLPDRISALAKELSGLLKGTKLRDLLDLDFPGGPLTIVSLKPPLDVTYNAVSTANLATLRLPDGAELDTRKLLAGEFKIPDLKPLECLGFTGVSFTVKSGRDELVRKYGMSNPNNTDSKQAPPNGGLAATNSQTITYVASERWTEWASLDTAVESGAKIYATGGEGAKEVAQGILDHLNMEILDILAWAKLQALQNPAGIAEHALTTLKELDLDDYDTWQKRALDHASLTIEEVPYTVEMAPSGKWTNILSIPAVSDAISKAGNIRLRFSKPHLGFALSYEGVPSRPSPQQMLEVFANQRSTEIAKSLENLIPSKLRSAAGGKDSIKILKDGRLAKALGLDFLTLMSRGALLAELRKLQEISKDPYVIDLKGAEFSKTIEAKAKQFTFFPRNGGDAKVERFTLDLNTGRIDLSISLTHKYEWKGLKQAYKDIQSVAKDGSGLLRSDAFRRFCESALKEVAFSDTQKKQVELALMLVEKAGLEDGLRGIGEKAGDLVRLIK